MTVQELREALADLPKDEEVPLSVVLPDLSYVAAALEDWLHIAEIFGRTCHPEVDQFLRDAFDSL